MGGTTVSGQYGLESLEFKLIVPPNGAGGGGRYLPSIVVVALGEPGVPVVCCANVGTIVSMVNVAADSNSADFFMTISLSAAPANGMEHSRQGCAGLGLIQINDDGSLRVTSRNTRDEQMNSALPSEADLSGSGWTGRATRKPIVVVRRVAVRPPELAEGGAGYTLNPYAAMSAPAASSRSAASCAASFSRSSFRSR